jgi:hypothetical protein
LIEKRLEAMMVLAIDDCDLDRGMAERLGGFETTKAGADNDDAR